MYPGPVEYHWLYKEAINKLASFERRVREGKDVEAAREFCAWLLFSKLDDILKPHDCQGALKVDSGQLRYRAEQLQREVQDAWRSGKVSHVDASALDGINRKLDLIAAQVAGFPAVPLKPQAPELAEGVVLPFPSP